MLLSRPESVTMVSLTLAWSTLLYAISICGLHQGRMGVYREFDQNFQILNKIIDLMTNE